MYWQGLSKIWRAGFKVYQNKHRTIDALKANIIEEIQTVTANVLARTFQNMARRAQSCLDANGGHLQHILWCLHISYIMRYGSFKFLCNILISGKIIKEMPGSVASGRHCIYYKIMGLPMYIRSVVDRNVVMRRISVFRGFKSSETSWCVDRLNIELVILNIPGWIESSATPLWAYEFTSYSTKFIFRFSISFHSSQLIIFLQ